MGWAGWVHAAQALRPGSRHGCAFLQTSLERCRPCCSQQPPRLTLSLSSGRQAKWSALVVLGVLAVSGIMPGLIRFQMVMERWLALMAA